mgnify:FL=1
MRTYINRVMPFTIVNKYYSKTTYELNRRRILNCCRAVRTAKYSDMTIFWLNHLIYFLNRRKVLHKHIRCEYAND